MNVYWKLEINDLRSLCESKGLSSLGLRGDLVNRLSETFPMDDIIESVRAMGDYYKGKNAVIIRSGTTGGCSGCKK